jgi:hypothetical protein
MGCLARLGGLALLAVLACSPLPAAAGPALPPAAARAWQTGLLRADRLEHASLSFTVGLGVGVLSKQPAAGAASALGLGLAKELRDRRHGGFDPVDLLADAIGAGLAAVAVRAAGR